MRGRQDEQIRDHTAPWRCGRPGCLVCALKPTYDKYMAAKFPDDKETQCQQETKRSG